MNSTGANSSTQRLALAGGALAAFLIAAHVVTDALASTFMALLPTIQARFALSETALAFLVALLSLSSLFTQPLFGALSDRLDSRLISALGVVLCTSLLSLLAVAPTVGALVVLLVLGGFGSAAFHPAASTVAREAGGRHAELTVSLFSAGGTLGLALGPVLVLTVIATRGLDFAAWLMVPGVVLGGLLYFIVPPKRSQPQTRRPRLVDTDLLSGPVGLLCLTGVFSSIAVVTFSSAIPLWLVADGGVARDDPLIGWTLGAFSLSAALGGITAGLLSAFMSRRALIGGSMLLALVPLLSLFALEPGTPSFFLAVMLAGMLVNAGLPLLLVSAQDPAPHAVATASGMLMGFTSGTAGLLYVGVGRLQEVIGLAPAMSLSYLMLIPGAVVAFAVLTKYPAPTGGGAERTAVVVATGVCGNVIIAPSALEPAALDHHGRSAIVVLHVSDLGCDPCRQAITDVLSPLDGVREVRVDLPTKRIQVEYDPRRVDPERLRTFLQEEDHRIASVT